MGAAPDPTELICTSRSNIGPLILQVRKRWEERVWASFIPLLVDKQANLKHETWYFTVTWIKITVRNGLEIFFSSHHFQTRTAIFFSSWDGSQTVHSWLLRQMCLLGTPQTSDAHLRQAHLPSRTHLCSPFWLSSFDQDTRSPQHPSYPNCFSLSHYTARSQCPPCSLIGRTPIALSPAIVSSRWDHGLCTFAVLGNGESRRPYPFPQSKCKHYPICSPSTLKSPWSQGFLQIYKLQK